ncbi:MAG: hypothetical protein HZA79_16925 [Sphingobacteriales bacterium]|nr:hypothetical protein [Sphingobacteriales bacterium]
MLGLTLFFSNCKKNENTSHADPGKSKNEFGDIKVPNNFFKETPVPGVAENGNEPTTYLAESDSSDPNNGDDPIILGQQVNNPYTISNMQQAYLQLYGSTAPVPVTHLYVRYKPANADQLALLNDQPDLELQDYPMDYKILQDGDYYQDPSLGTEDIGWLYTAVPANYTPVPGIQYEIIQQLHIPPIDNLLLESMAESLSGGAIYDDTVILANRYITRVDEPSDTLIVPNRMPVPCELDPCFPSCPNYDPALCGGGGGGGGSTYDPQIPRGAIYVQDQRTCNTITTPITNVPVRQARIVCKRWFKIWRGYTNDQGQFTAGKKFKNKVKIILKTENNNARISKIRGIRIWQVLFPVKKRLGVFDQGAMANINYIFTKPNPTSAHDKELPYWVAATTHNSVLEYGQYASENNIPSPPSQLKVLITNWGFMEAAGASPMFNKCPGSMTVNYASFFIAQPTFFAIVNGLSQLVQYLTSKVDVIIGYKAALADYNCRLTSARLKALTYHELGHTSHYAQAGCDFWIQYRQAIVHELLSSSRPPYGEGNDTEAAIVATGEMWGNHCEYFFTNRHYGNGGANGSFAMGGFTAPMQGFLYENIPGGLNCYLNAIENHDPHITNPNNDQWPWIPQGICYDLGDLAGEIFPVIDNVSGYNISQCFNSLQSDVRSVQAFKGRLLQQNGNTQQTQVTQLFQQYGY